jgi:hypothetical protein
MVCLGVEIDPLQGYADPIRDVHEVASLEGRHRVALEFPSEDELLVDAGRITMKHEK